jgi:hypothetical protein
MKERVKTRKQSEDNSDKFTTTAEYIERIKCSFLPPCVTGATISLTINSIPAFLKTFQFYYSTIKT